MWIDPEYYEDEDEKVYLEDIMRNILKFDRKEQIQQEKRVIKEDF